MNRNDVVKNNAKLGNGLKKTTNFVITPRIT